MISWTAAAVIDDQVPGGLDPGDNLVKVDIQFGQGTADQIPTVSGLNFEGQIAAGQFLQ